MKKKKLNSKNPKYNKDILQDEKVIKKRELMCNAKVRTSSGKDTGETAKVYNIWYV
jgi:hypothetical protein